MKLFLLVLLCVAAIFAVPTKYDRSTKANCGYASCPQVTSETFNVHIVPHSHDDVGWLKTVDQYYFGANTTIQRAGVQYIISSVVDALLINPERRFIQVESAFFYQWWLQQTEEVRNQFKGLIDNGQLEIIGGAWSMNDEAATHYHSIIDQFTHGLRTVSDTLGECGRPKIGWQIDPFGHSKEMASIFSQLGYEAMFFSRLDWRDKRERMRTKTPEMIWQGSASLGDESNIFLSVLYNHYSAPQGYCFDILCNTEPIIDDESIPLYNYEDKVKGFANFIKDQAENYVTNNIIITMGDDFNYQDALSYYKNMDKLLAGFTKFPQYYKDKLIKVFYSTPSCYVKAVNDEATASGIAFPLKTDDFFPYASDPHAYWTGYFTSRPTSKRYERQGNNVLQITKQISTFVKDEKSLSELSDLKDAIGIMQHHDAITGTEKQHVADDYHRIVTLAIEKSISRTNDILSMILPSEQNVNLNLQSCLLANVSICTLTQDDEFIAAVYNPLSREVSPYIRLPVNNDQEYQIIDPDDNSLNYQIVKSIHDFKYLEEFISSPAPYDLIFRAENIAPLGLKLYKVMPISNKITKGDNAEKNEVKTKKNSRIVVGDDVTNGFVIDDTTGRLSRITLGGINLDVTQELMYYVGATGNNQGFENRSSGAYIFRPDPEYPSAISFPGPVLNEIVNGELVDEVHQTFSSWAKQIVRLYKDTNSIEIDWLIGPIDVEDQLPKEVISRFQVSFNTSDVFYTDSNGREMIKRIRNYRATYPLEEFFEDAAGNYYPVTSKISLRDEENNLEFAILNDRAQGGGSLEVGQLEVMLHRRLLSDDAFGVGEALDETEYGEKRGLVARGQLFITLGKMNPSDGSKSAVAIQTDIAQQKLLGAWTYLTNNVDLWNTLTKKMSGLQRSLPENVQILTLEPWDLSNLDEPKLLLRLEHVFAINTDDDLSKSVEVDLEGLFTYFSVKTIQETTLGANQLLEDKEKLSWEIGEDLENVGNTVNTQSGRKYEYIKAPKGLRDPKITLEPMQIKTFVLVVEYH